MVEKNKEFYIKAGAVVVFVISCVVLIGIKIANKEMSIKIPLIVTGIIGVVCVIAFFGGSIYKKMKKLEEGIPKAIDEEEIVQRIEKEVLDMFNMIRIDNPFEWKRSKVINKNEIHAYKINLVHERCFGEENFKSAIFIINANYPQKGISIINPESSEHLVTARMNDMSQSPLDEPEVEERTELDLNTGRETRYRKTRPKKKEDKKDGAVV